jgi:hypothetical protein
MLSLGSLNKYRVIKAEKFVERIKAEKVDRIIPVEILSLGSLNKYMGIKAEKFVERIKAEIIPVEILSLGSLS